MEYHGFFSPPEFIGVTDESKRTVDSRGHGKQMLSTTMKSGQTASEWGPGHRKMLPLFENEVYYDPATARRREKSESKKKWLTPNGFVPPTTPKKPSGTASYYGCFGPVPEHSVDPLPAHGTIQHAPRQIQTSPGKKGSYGFTGLTFSKEVEYLSSPFESMRLQELETNRDHRKKMLGPAFKSNSVGRPYFGCELNVDAPKILKESEMPKNSKATKAKEKGGDGDKEDEDEKRDSIAVPFRPSSWPKSGLNGTINPYPEHSVEPFQQMLEDEKKRREELRKQQVGPAWRPNYGYKSTRTPSIVAKAVYLGETQGWSLSPN